MKMIRDGRVVGMMVMSGVLLGGGMRYKTTEHQTKKVAPITTVAADSMREDIIAMLGRSAQAWNRGDLDAFVSDYAPGMRTTFVTSKKILRGPEVIKTVYAPRFAAGGQRDSLSFENVEVDVLGSDVINVIAFYKLTRGDSTTARGPTSLVMVKMDGRWRIIHDHSS